MMGQLYGDDLKVTLKMNIKKTKVMLKKSLGKTIYND